MDSSPRFPGNVQSGVRAYYCACVNGIAASAAQNRRKTLAAADPAKKFNHRLAPFRGMT
jgi:hypothetical protein